MTGWLDIATFKHDFGSQGDRQNYNFCRSSDEGHVDPLAKLSNALRIIPNKVLLGEIS